MLARLRLILALADLRNTLKDLLLTLCKKPHAFSMDFDPHRETAADDAASKNLEQVRLCFRTDVSALMPRTPRRLQRHSLSASASRSTKFRRRFGRCATSWESLSPSGSPRASSRRTILPLFACLTSLTPPGHRIGGFIFLRFINPAIVSPEVIDLDLPADNRDVRRGLVMITKVVSPACLTSRRLGETDDRTVAAASTCEQRSVRSEGARSTRASSPLHLSHQEADAGAQVLNAFMDNTIFDMTRFLQSISHYAEEPLEVASEAMRDPTPGLDASEHAFLFQFISDNTDKLGMELLQGSFASLRGGRAWNELTPLSCQGKQSSGQVGARTWERVTTLIATLGPPPEAASRAAAAGWDASPEQACRSFMARNEARATADGTSLWRRCFFPIGGNKVRFCFAPLWLGSFADGVAERASDFLYPAQPYSSRDGGPRVASSLHPTCAFTCTVFTSLWS